MKIAAIVAFVGWLWTDDPLIAGSILGLGLVWTLLQAEEGPPVLALALTFQWLSVTVGLFYVVLTGRTLMETISSDYRSMVGIGLGCVAALTVGAWLGRWLIDRQGPVAGLRPANAFSTHTMLIGYVVSVAAFGAVVELASYYPSIRQPIIALSYIRLGWLYLVFRRLVHVSNWPVMLGVLAFEIVMGITGFYAGFREPLMMAALALLEVFDRRSVRHWLTIGGLGVAACVLGIVWVTVRVDYRGRFVSDVKFQSSRSARLDSITSLTKGLAAGDSSELQLSVDRFVERLWVIYYPALAVARVPRVLPHTDGRLMSDTLQFVFMPRIFFPDKPNIGSESDMVRKYSGVFVAGEKEGTSIAFGYAAESYIDYGIPMMFVPSLLYGVFIGLCYASLLRMLKHRDLAISVVTMICWMSLYLFERSWAKTIGLAGTLLIYVGALAYFFDRLWYERFRASLPTAWTPGGDLDPQHDGSGPAPAAYSPLE